MPDELNYIPAINSTALPGKGDQANYYPALNTQQVIDGQYLQAGSAPKRSLEEFPSVDKIYTAGEDITAGQACGIWGYITETSEFLDAAQATFVRSDQSSSNFDSTSPLETNELVKHGLVSWSSMPVIPSGTGLTIITIKVTFKYSITGGTSTSGEFNNNTATFDETLVVWDDRPAHDSFQTNYGFGAGSGLKTGTKVTLTPTQYNNLKANGLTSVVETGNALEFEDEDAGNPPRVQVEFIYKIQDGSAFLSSGLTSDQADGFRGIAQNDAVKGQEVILRQEGIDDDHLTGLTAFSDYQLSDTPGSIQTGTSATSDKVIGNARSATSFHVKYVLNDAT